MTGKKKILIAAAAALTLAASLLVLKKHGPEAAEALQIEVSRADEYAGEPEEAPKTLQDWQKINPKVKYVLIFPDETVKRTIPVIAAPSAEYAMKHNIRNEYDTMGSVFCDPAAVMPENLVIYGHSSKTKDWNFTFFKNYRNPAYYHSHPSVLLEEESGITPCRIISFASYDLEKDAYVGWADAQLSGRDEILAMLENTVPNLIQKTGGFVYHGEGIVTLVTCDMEKEDTRFVIKALRGI